MATNEIYKYGDWLTVPVPTNAVPGSPVLFGEGDAAIPGVVHALFKAPLPDVPGYITIPTIPNGNEDGEDLADLENSPALRPDDMVFGSVAFRGVWAFDLGDDLTAVTIGDPVYITRGTAPAASTLSLTAGGDGIYGHVHNVGFDGNVHVRLAAVLLPSA